MNEVGAAPTHHDTVRVRVGLYGRDGVRQPAEREVHREGAYEFAVLVLHGLTVGSNHLFRIDVVGVIVNKRLCPCRTVEQFTELVPVHHEIVIMLVTLLGSLDGLAVVVAESREVLAAILEVVRFEGDGTAVEVGIVLQNTATIYEHRVGGVEMTGGEPVGIVGGHFHAVEDVGYAEHGVVEHLSSPVHGLLFHGPARLIEQIAEGCQEDYGSEEHDPEAEPRGKRLTDVFQGGLHKSIWL